MNSPLLQKSQWTIIGKLPQDGGVRSYTRIEKNGIPALYMDCGDMTRKGASDVRDFIRIGDWLRGIGVQTPEIYEVDIESNSAIIEDFGSISLKQAMAGGADALTLYKGAAEILEIMQAADCPLELPHFEQSFMRQARQRFVDWYVPAIRGQANDEGLVGEYHALWDGIERNIAPYKNTFMHVDFHVENMMYLAGNAGRNAIGVIDFQEGMIGPEAYDMSNLLEDMRADVPLEIRAALLAGKSQDYLDWYRVMGTQFHCRLLGQIMRWAFVENKTQYLQYYPRLVRYVQDALSAPVLAPFKDWLEKNRIEITDLSTRDWRAAKTYISGDAI